MLHGFSKADAGVEDDAIRRNAGPLRGLGPLVQVTAHGDHHVTYGFPLVPGAQARVFHHGFALRPVVHEDDRYPQVRSHRGHLGVGAEGPNVVDEVSTDLHRRPGHPGLVGVDGDGSQPFVRQGFNDGQNPAHFFFRGDRFGTGPGAFPTHVQEVRAFFLEAPGLLHGRAHPIGPLEQAVAGEGIGGDVEDAHDEGFPAPVEEAPSDAHRGPGPGANPRGQHARGQRGRGLPQTGMHPTGRNFGQGHQHEGPFVEMWMRKGEGLPLDHQVVVEQ